MHWSAQGASNIALIKYMGKKQVDQNVPANSSLSYTLDNLLSFVEINLHDGDYDLWEPLVKNGCSQLDLTKPQQEKFLNHLKFIKQQYNCNQNFIVKSCNSFPAATGLASSASSFAALTKAAIKAICELNSKPLPSIEEMAKISQQGSGSSCRSFFSPWAMWSEKKVEPLELPYKNLIHQTILVSTKAKKISSSLAHKLVQTSPHYKSRLENMDVKLNHLLDSFKQNDWAKIYQCVKEEFLDMHKLFETSSPSFSYMTNSSKKIINDIECHWKDNGDGPLITMDAGPNVHLLYRSDQIEVAKALQTYFTNNYAII